MEPTVKTTIADTDGLRYRIEDLRWVVEPTDDDFGMLEPIDGAVPYEGPYTEDWP